MLIVLCILIILVDQAAKLYVSTALTLGTSIPVIKEIFHITYIHNPGAAFGVLANQQMLFIIFTFALLAVTAFFYKRLLRESFAIRYGATLLLGGALGNLIDRIRFSYVIDFFDFRIWPVFNIADIAICVGVGLLMYSVLFEMEETED